MEAHAGDAKVSAFRRLAGLRGAPPPPAGSWQRWLGVLACLRRLQGDRWPSLLQASLASSSIPAMPCIANDTLPCRCCLGCRRAIGS